MGRFPDTRLLHSHEPFFYLSDNFQGQQQICPTALLMTRSVAIML